MRSCLWGEKRCNHQVRNSLVGVSPIYEVSEARAQRRGQGVLPQLEEARELPEKVAYAGALTGG